jgi:hypothetical protein
MVKNAGRLEHEKDVILRIEGYRTGPNRDDRDAHLVRNGQPVNIDVLILVELRVLASDQYRPPKKRLGLNTLPSASVKAAIKRLE